MPGIDESETMMRACIAAHESVMRHGSHQLRALTRLLLFTLAEETAARLKSSPGRPAARRPEARTGGPADPEASLATAGGLAGDPRTPRDPRSRPSRRPTRHRRTVSRLDEAQTTPVPPNVHQGADEPPGP